MPKIGYTEVTAAEMINMVNKLKLTEGSTKNACQKAGISVNAYMYWTRRIGILKRRAIGIKYLPVEPKVPSTRITALFGQLANGNMVKITDLDVVV